MLRSRLINKRATTGIIKDQVGMMEHIIKYGNLGKMKNIITLLEGTLATMAIVGVCIGDNLNFLHKPRIINTELSETILVNKIKLILKLININCITSEDEVSLTFSNNL